MEKKRFIFDIVRIAISTLVSYNNLDIMRIRMAHSEQYEK